MSIHVYTVCGILPVCRNMPSNRRFPPVVVRIGPADLPYVVHQYARHAFGLVMNRDLNAAVHLKHLAEKSPAGKVLQVDHVRPTA